MKAETTSISNDDAPVLHVGALVRTAQDLHAEGEFSELQIGLSDGNVRTMHFPAPVRYQISINSVGGDDFYLQGRLRGRMQSECARCLRPVEVPVNTDLGMLMRYDGTTDFPHIAEAPTGEDLLMFAGPQLDLSDFFAEAMLLDVPLVVLHDEDCKGLCQVCGTDLNESSCEHKAAVPIEGEASAAPTDPRWAALAGLQLPDDQ